MEIEVNFKATVDLHIEDMDMSEVGMIIGHLKDLNKKLPDGLGEHSLVLLHTLIEARDKTKTGPLYFSDSDYYDIGD